jgi:predicted nucleotidyltransferase
MVDILKIQSEIVERLRSLQPEKIILFGSYALGNATEDSDIDLFLVKNPGNEQSDYELLARKKLRDLIFKYRIGFDVLAASQEFLDGREDHFYKVDILTDGKVIYAK